MELKAGYKKTEVGVIPEDWALKSIDSIATIATGNTPPTQDTANYGDAFLFVSPTDLGHTKFISQTEKMLSKKGFSISRHFPKESILFVCIGSTIGKCGIATEELTSNQQINAIFPSSVFSTDYVYYAVSAAASKIKALAGEQAVPIVNKTQFSETVIPLPPTKAEQEAIAEALSDVDALIESLEQLIAKKRQIKQGAMQELLTGKKRLPGFSENWQLKQIGETLSIAHGKSQHAVTDQNGIYPILATGGQIGTANRFLYDKPSVLIGRKGTIDKPQYMDQPFWTVDTLFYSVIHYPNNAKFLFYRICLIDWKQYNEASGVPSLNARTIEKVEINIPQPEEQTAIATILSDMDTEITELDIKLSKARKIKQGMMQELLTGKTRLV
ncbi:MAG: restriction endonuclease subunit S [Methylococcales bacterium]